MSKKPKSPLKRAGRGLRRLRYRAVDALYLRLDRARIRRTRNIRLIPRLRNRRGGKVSYAEWAHVVGVFQTLLYTQLAEHQGVRILDVGCGTGLMGIACEPFLVQGGHYVGLDVREAEIEFCRSHFPESTHSFVHHPVANASFAPDQPAQQLPWKLESESFDAVSALSVWTHFAEKDASFYLKEVRRVLRPGGVAIITAFLLDEAYERRHAEPRHSGSAYHTGTAEDWVFDVPAYGSDEWFCPRWAHGVPEVATGVTPAGLARIAGDAGLKQIAYYPGNWKELPGVYFQDVLVFQRPPADERAAQPPD